MIKKVPQCCTVQWQPLRTQTATLASTGICLHTMEYPTSPRTQDFIFRVWCPHLAALEKTQAIVRLCHTQGWCAASLPPRHTHRTSPPQQHLHHHQFQHLSFAATSGHRGSSQVPGLDELGLGDDGVNEAVLNRLLRTVASTRHVGLLAMAGCKSTRDTRVLVFFVGHGHG